MVYCESGRFIELYFDEKPETKLREALKICGWQYNNKKKCWQNFINDENRQFARLLVKDDKSSDDWLDGLEVYCFKSDNQIIIRSNSFYCNIHHSLEDIAGEITVIDKRGVIREYIVPMAYCKSCELYFILKETYTELKSKGLIRCQIMTYEQYIKEGFYDGNYAKWREKGPLKLWGYSVDSQSNLSELQRRVILEDIVDCGAMTKDAVLSYLDFFIRLNAGKGAGFVSKWQADRSYIAEYRLGSARRVVFKD